ncbi:9530_t:CDS:1 [Racocetra fulgida]|uniref:9530_t:CDS:1 n=1 Tax=Racocetra fulgida TaxID=60492 RepID=A0A9N8ZD90_9GLOM|nr:9530_t:CDS:1 [Racocetra fulgida]
MQSAPNRFSKNRSNVTQACDACKRKKIKCDNAGHLDQSTKCSVCIKHNYECVYSTKPKKRGPKPKKGRPNSQGGELFPGLSQEDIKLVSNWCRPDQKLSFVVDILTSTSSLPCRDAKIEGHCCHMGCIVRYKNN